MQRLLAEMLAMSAPAFMAWDGKSDIEAPSVYTLTGDVTVSGKRAIQAGGYLLGSGIVYVPVGAGLTVNGNLGPDVTVRYGVQVNGGDANQPYYQAGETVTITAAVPAGMTFSRWSGPAGVTFANAAATTTTFVMSGEPVTVTAIFAYTARDRNDSDDSGSNRTWTPPVTAATEYIIDEAEMKKLIAAADKNGWDFARASSALPTTVKAGAWKLLTGKKFVARTTIDKIVQVQLTFPEPSRLTADRKVSGYVKGSIVDSRRAFFEKWFSNKLRIVHLSHTGSFGQAVEIAAKVDLTDMDTDNLYFYSYDKSANSYKRIEKPAYWIDKNGYLHFTTGLAGDIIVSEGPLKKR